MEAKWTGHGEKKMESKINNGDDYKTSCKYKTRKSDFLMCTKIEFSEIINDHQYKIETTSIDGSTHYVMMVLINQYNQII